MRPDGTDFLIRTWAHVEQVQGSGANNPSNRLIIEIRQPFVWGVPAGPLTTQTVRRRRLAARRRGERQAAEARSRQSAGFRERLAIAREAIEEYGVPAAHARWDAEEAAGQRRQREVEEFHRSVRQRTASPEYGHQQEREASRPGREGELEIGQEAAVEEDRQGDGRQEEERRGEEDGGLEEDGMGAGPSNWQELPGVYRAEYEEYGDEPEDWE